MYALYSVLLLLALIVTAPWWLLEMLRHGKYRTGLGERLGKVPDRLLKERVADTIWIHAVSVGEVLAVSRVVEELSTHLPSWRIVVSTTTDTGQKLARDRFGENNVFYVPLDLPFVVRAYLKALRPKMLLLAESEFWPNLLRWARLSGAAVAVVNARVSDRSLPGYLRIRRPLARVLQNVQLFLAQSEEDARRLIQMGAPDARVHVSGNLKFEVRRLVNPAILAQLKVAIERERISPVLVAGSTLEGEEAMLLPMFRQALVRYSDALLILAPRHPERFEAVASLLAASGIGHQRRSRWDGEQPVAGRIFLLDSIGELASLYQLADLAFVGGSLVPRGGHNVLEAAQFGVPILVGPHTENFRDTVEIFRNADAVRIVTPEFLSTGVLRLLENRDERVRLGKRAAEVMRSQLGATERTVNALLELLPESARAVAELSSGKPA